MSQNRVYHMLATENTNSDLHFGFPFELVFRSFLTFMNHLCSNSCYYITPLLAIFPWFAIAVCLLCVILHTFLFLLLDGACLNGVLILQQLVMLYLNILMVFLITLSRIQSIQVLSACRFIGLEVAYGAFLVNWRWPSVVSESLSSFF